MTVECDEHIFGKIPKFNSAEGGSVALSVNIELNVEEFGLQRLFNNPIICKLL